MPPAAQAIRARSPAKVARHVEEVLDTSSGHRVALGRQLSHFPGRPAQPGPLPLPCLQRGGWPNTDSPGRVPRPGARTRHAGSASGVCAGDRSGARSWARTHAPPFRRQDLTRRHLDGHAQPGAGAHDPADARLRRGGAPQPVELVLRLQQSRLRACAVKSLMTSRRRPQGLPEPVPAERPVVVGEVHLVAVHGAGDGEAERSDTSRQADPGQVGRDGVFDTRIICAGQHFQVLEAPGAAENGETCVRASHVPDDPHRRGVGARVRRSRWSMRCHGPHRN